MEIDNNFIEELKQLTRDSTDFDKKCAQLGEEIKSGNLTIGALVEQLGPLLVDTDPNNRELGTWVLTQVLDRLPLNHLDKNQLEFICAFFTDRIKDHHQVIPAVLKGVLALSKFREFPEGAARKILSALFQNVPCQQQREDDRLNIYRIFSVFLEKFSSELCAMEFDFVYGVISAVDGERNPRNLIFLFEWFPKFLKTVTLGHLSEEAFEVLACYFPVDFKAPAQDPNAVTRDQLASALAPCLTCIPQFAEFCFSLALEKLDSSLEIAKLDSLQLLELGCSSFDGAAYAHHATEIWSQIQKEVFSTPNPMVETKALSTLTSIVKKLSEDPNLKTTLKDLADTLKGNLIPDSKLFEPSAKLLLSVSAASPAASDQITKEIAPILINTYNITNTVAHRAKILSVLIGFFVRYVGFRDAIEFEELRNVPVLCLKASRDESDQLKCVGFEGLRRISRFLTEDVRLSTYVTLRTLMVTNQKDDVRGAMLACFETLAESFSSEVKEHVISEVEITNEQSLRCYFDALSVIVSQVCFTQTVVDILLKYLSCNGLSRVVVQTLRRITTKYESDEKIRSVLLEKNLISLLIRWCEGHESGDIESLLDVAFVLKSLIGAEPSERQREIIGCVPQLELTNPRRVFVLDGLLSRLRSDVDIDYKILNDLTHLVISESDTTVKNTAAQLLANILNKCQVDDTILTYLGQFNEKQVDLVLMSWIVKALIMRNHHLANDWTDKLLALLESDERAAVCFRVVINDHFDSLSPKSHSIRTILYQQKFFTAVTNRLCQTYTPECKSYLLAVGYLLESAPKQVILLQFKKILKLVVLCLDECDEPEILMVILQIIKEFVDDAEKCVQDQMSDFLTRFLKLATFEKSMKVRILAVQCLQACISAFPVYKLLVHKQEVLTVLGKVIDDKKRMVRREAVEARSMWFLLDAPE